MQPHADGPGTATANARALQSAERVLGVGVEPAVNHWLAGHSFLGQAAVLYYRLYYLPVLGVLGWVVFRRGALYPRIRWALIVTALVALLVFWAWPVSPPRFAMPGIVDVVAEHDVGGNRASRDLGNGQNHFSAFPSLHVAWSVLAAWVAWSALGARRPRLAILPWLFPIGMVAVVIGTGNHYLLDVLGSAALVAVAIATASVLEAVEKRRLVRRRRAARPPGPSSSPGDGDDGSGVPRRR
ncbi:phosphatase PAP2 family protein [Tersicoccus sp. MR15.9]|uniref:phosphatase PAP2 family protein n=1 Tax=Tersicoccus mangrovi TaxID=3121635 RepID=UPI002FE5AAAF